MNVCTSVCMTKGIFIEKQPKLHLLENCIVARATILQNLLSRCKAQEDFHGKQNFNFQMQKFQF